MEQTRDRVATAVPERLPSITPVETKDSTGFASQEERYDKLKTLAKEAVDATHKAMDSDEAGQKTVACGQYNVAVGLLDYAISYTKSWEYAEEHKQAVAITRINLQKNRDNILDRLRVLQAETGRDDSLSYLYGPSVNRVNSPDELRNRMPPPYVEDGSAVTVMTGSSTATYACDTNNGVLIPNFEVHQQAPIEANEVFSIPENIQIYFISPTDDNVSAPSYPSFLRIIVIDLEEEDSEVPSAEQVTSPKPPAFLQVGDWTYPLIPGQSPVYKASVGSYIFPDLNSPGSSIGLVFPSDVSETKRATFEDVLLQLLGLRQFPNPAMFEKAESSTNEGVVSSSTKTVAPTPSVACRRESDSMPESKPSELYFSEDTYEYSTSTTIASSITSGAEAIAKGIVYSAQKTSEYIAAGANYLIERINPVPTEPTVKPEVKKSVKTVKSVSGKAVKVSGYIVNQVGRGTLLLGRQVAPYIQRTTARMYAKATEKSDAEARKSVDGAFELAAGCAVGLATVYIGLEQGARILASSLGSNTVKIIDKRYGQQVGSLATDGMSAIGNTVSTGYNVHCLGPKSIAKRVVKDAALTAITEREGFTPKAVNSSSSLPACSIATVSSGATGTISSPTTAKSPDAPPRPPPPRKHK